MISKQLEIVNKLGLHARAAAKLVSTASQFSSEVLIDKDGQTVNGKSIMGVMMLAAAKGSVITVSIQGDDEAQAMNTIASLVADYFGEGE